ncbi:class F sortase [Pengzhenrongella frigida]|uniref:Class F sortase n=1 Tax=Pengzhenrongella frigida TaxID=1259133 RepID=A0A4Q5N0Y8_9MICO|nr:class F sortase [Cellulomonas sp. HLT2-17]RYV51696.1 class F sortase [Cellulomonas sp. HLT2-17]
MSHRTGRRTPTLAIALAVVAVAGLLAGCTPSDPQDATAASTASSTRAPSPRASSSATPAPVPDVPVASADLGAVPSPVVIPPTRLRIPAQDIELPIDAVGVQADGQMEVPPLAERGGWYRFGAAPGQDEGTAVIAAHVDSVASAGLGPFARLEDLVAGDVVEVTRQDGTRRQYTVSGVRRVAKTDVPWAEIFVRDGDPRLVLVTCGGVFQPAIGRYADNVIVTADPVAD